jgi:hypothetical protein
LRQRSIGAGLLLGLVIVLVCSACSENTTVVNLPKAGTPPLSVTATVFQSPYPGRWQSTDKDGSHQTLGITEDAAVLSVTYNDTVATVCGGNPAMATGSAIAAGYKLTLTMSVSCLNPTKYWGTAPYIFTYTLAADTLTDNYAIIWHRY